MSVTCRAATVEDRGAVTRLLTAQLEEHSLPVDPDGIARAVELALSHGSIAWLAVALSGGFVVGVTLANPIVSVEHGGASLWIEELYVQPSSRRKGAARALVAFLFDQARANGLRAVALEVVTGMAAADAFWRSLGFTPLDRRSMVKPIG